jgi:flagellum-specific ATP synthase
MPECQSIPEREVVRQARKVMSAYANMEELIRIGAYRSGADPDVDRAIILNPDIEQFLRQDKEEYTPLDESFTLLADILNQG